MDAPDTLATVVDDTVMKQHDLQLREFKTKIFESTKHIRHTMTACSHHLHKCSCIDGIKRVSPGLSCGMNC